MANSPEKIGKYYALEVVGSGNMAIVYRGYDPFTDREVAIKVSHEKLEAMNFPGTFTRKLFFNEAQAAGALVHPNIVRVLDAGEQDGAPYLVMDYIGEGKTLDVYRQTLQHSRDLSGSGKTHRFWYCPTQQHHGRDPDYGSPRLSHLHIT